VRLGALKFALRHIFLLRSLFPQAVVLSNPRGSPASRPESAKKIIKVEFP